MRNNTDNLTQKQNKNNAKDPESPDAQGNIIFQAKAGRLPVLYPSRVSILSGINIKISYHKNINR